MKNNGKRYSEEQIVRIVRELESGKNLAEIFSEYGVAEGTVYRWRSKYGGIETAALQRLRELEVENARLKRIVAQQALDNDALKELVSKKWWAHQPNGAAFNIWWQPRAVQSGRPVGWWALLELVAVCETDCQRQRSASKGDPGRGERPSALRLSTCHRAAEAPGPGGSITNGCNGCGNTWGYKFLNETSINDGLVASDLRTRLGKGSA